MKKTIIISGIISLIAFVTFIILLTGVLTGSAKAAAKDFPIDPLVLDVIIEVESSGNPKAVSPKGAKGLMQVTDIALKDVVLQKAKLSPRCQSLTLTSDLFDPTTNIAAGQCYMEILARTFSIFAKSNLDLDIFVLAAYNAGPSRTMDYILLGRPLPPETINYVKKIVRIVGERLEVEKAKDRKI